VPDDLHIATGMCPAPYLATLCNLAILVLETAYTALIKFLPIPLEYLHSENTIPHKTKKKQSLWRLLDIWRRSKCF